MNADGHLDLAVANANGTHTIAGLPRRGTGGFGAGRDFDAGDCQRHRGSAILTGWASRPGVDDEMDTGVFVAVLFDR